MSSYVWAQLNAGRYGLPGPAVVTSPWVLEVRARRPRWRGFTRVRRAEHWSRVRTAKQMVADYSDPWDVLVVSAKRLSEVDADGLRNLVPGAASAGGVHWQIGSVFQGPTAQAFHDQVHRVGRLLLLTGDLQAHWSAVHAGRRASFSEMFPDGAWAAWLPLLVHLYDDGVGTRPV